MTVTDNAAAERRTPRRTWLWFGAAALVLLVCKIGLAVALRRLPLLGDEINYWQWSERYFATYWTRDESWGPVQFAFLDLVRTIVPGATPVTARVFQLLVHTATAAVILDLGRELDNHRTGLAAGILYLILPEPVSFSYLLFSETIGAFLFFSAALIYLWTMDRDGPAGYIGMAGAGACFGLACLARAINLYFLPLWIAHLIIVGRAAPRPKALATALFVIGLAAPISVQTYKNYLVFHEFLPINTNSWVTFWTAHNTFEPPDHNFYGPYLASLQDGFPGARPEPPGKGPNERQREEMKNALAFIADHPGLTLRRTARKVADLFHPSLYIYRNFYVAPPDSFAQKYLDRPGLLTALSATSALMMLLAAAGLAFGRERRVRGFAIALIAFHLAVAAFFFGPTRFRMAFTPMLVIFMAFAVVHYRELWRDRVSRRGLAAGIIWSILMIDWARAAVRLLSRYHE